MNRGKTVDIFRSRRSEDQEDHQLLTNYTPPLLLFSIFFIIGASLMASGLVPKIDNIFIY